MGEYSDGKMSGRFSIISLYLSINGFLIAEPHNGICRGFMSEVDIDLAPHRAVLTDDAGNQIIVNHGAAALNTPADALLPGFEQLARLDDVSNAVSQLSGVPVTIRLANGTEIQTDTKTINPLIGLNLEATANVNNSFVASLASRFMSNELENVDTRMGIDAVASAVQRGRSI